MGLLSEGSPLSWEETKNLAQHVREHGILQFINLYHKLKDRSRDVLRWGDEVEYMLVKIDKEAKRAKLKLSAESILEVLQEKERQGSSELQTLWRPEYAAYCVEGTPGKPYGHRMAHFNLVEANMKKRRLEVQQLLGKDEYAMTLTAYPRLGCPNFSEPSCQPTPLNGASKSLFFPDGAIFQGHPRFQTLTRNIRSRRGEKVAINIPVFKDKYTPSPFIEDLYLHGDDGDSSKAALPDHVYMDAMGFGMGCSCLQMTFQACNIQEARRLYDQLTPLTPILLALSAASPIYRGYLTDTDCRWNVIAASVDCRTRAERGLEPLTTEKFQIPKSRYDSIDSYLSPGSEKWNDIPLVYDTDVYQQLLDAGIDHLLAQHVAHLFIRDTVSLFSEKIHQNDETDTDHFENIQSTNWQTMRFKPPPPHSSIGWRVEFRPTEVQLTDFENAAYVVFVVLLTRVILSFNLDLLIPISKVDENMKRCQKRGALLTEKFHFKKDITTANSPPVAEECCANVLGCQPQNNELTINEIINGKPNEFPGFIPLINTFLESIDDCDVDTSCTIAQYLKLISKRASGELMTTATWIRDFVQNHPEYKQDSIVTENINYDLVEMCQKITMEEIVPESLIQPHKSKSSNIVPKAMEKAESYIQGKASGRNGVKNLVK